MQINDNASQASIHSRALWSEFLVSVREGSVAPLVGNADFLKNMTFNLQTAVPYTRLTVASSAEGDQRNCSNSEISLEAESVTIRRGNSLLDV